MFVEKIVGKNIYKKFVRRKKSLGIFHKRRKKKMFNAMNEYFYPKVEYIIIHIDWIGTCDHHATICSDSKITKYAYFLNSPHGREYHENEIVLGYVFDDIFNHIKEGKTYNCKVVNGKIMELVKCKTKYF